MRPSLRFAAAALVMAMVFPAAASAMSVKFFLGQVTLKRSGKSLPVKVGDIVGNGDIIKTGKGAMVELAFDQTSTITVRADSTVQIGSKNLKDSDGISVVSGEISGKFGKLKKGEYKIGSPTTVCGVRGTEFDIAVSKGGDTYVVLNEGKLAVRNPYGNTDLNGGSSLEADIGEEIEKGDIDEKASDWGNSRNESLEEGLDEQAEKYENYMEKFEEDADEDAELISDLRSETKKAKTKDDLEKSGEKIAQSDSDLEDSMMMNEASIFNMNSLSEDFQGSDAAGRFKKAVKKGNAVLKQQIKNRQAIEKVKADYKEAYDRIMKKFQDDKSNIFRNLEEFKKRQREDME
ncbi:MAG TPA: FecR domain-containing protein [Spirochaetota bacterium]|nr:FecR domain-containing protein [Spirochaetota bacterium]HPJ33297.1 FecR domain-containing protein [Spirochaetota bacterium]